MSKAKKIRIVILAFAVAVGMISTIVAADMANNSPVPGSADDPLVTLSYVTSTLKPQIEADILAALSGTDVSAILNALNSNVNNSVPPQTTEPQYQQPTQPAPANTGESDADALSIPYEIVELMVGQMIRPVSGSVEIIARPGTTAVALTSYTDQGIGDLTTGTEILNNQPIPINHLLMIPRADGRAIQILSNVAYVMVRGDYEIVY